jgi:uncharacterized protein YidB (DUF937 family)
MGLLDILNGMQNGPRGQRQPTPPGQGGGMSPIMMALLGLLAYKAVKHMTGGGASAGGGAPTPLPPGTQTADSRGGGLGDILSGMLNGPRGNPNAASTSAGTSAGTPTNVPTTAPGTPGNLGDVLGSILGGGRSPAGPSTGGTAPGNNPMAGNAGGFGGLGGLLGGLLAGGAAGSVLSGGLGQVLQDLQRSGHGSKADSWVGTGENENIAPNDLAKALGADTINALSQHTGLSTDELLQGLSQNLPDLVDRLTPHGRLPTENEASQW